MKLVHRSETSAYKVAASRVPLHIRTDAGWKMQSIFLKAMKICNNSKNDDIVVWDSAHHEVTLWFEDEKWVTYFNLRGLDEFTQE